MADKGGFMIRAIICIVMLIGSSLIARAGACTRESLQSAVDSYIAAQQAGDPAMMRTSKNIQYSQNTQNGAVYQGILSEALKIDFHRDFLDVDACRTFSEVVVTDVEHPYVLGIRLTVKNDKISEMESIVTDAGDWKFSADNSLKYISAEDWHVLPGQERISRQALIDAANAYMDRFTYENIKVPWGIPCARLEGGEYTGDGPRATCKVGIPLEAIEIVDRSFVVDVDMGTINVFSRFGKTKADSSFGETKGLPDSHTLRMVNGKIRYIHSMSVVGE
jgi:hypothetical protein